MFSKPQSGFTLIEMIIAIVILGVGLAGLLTAFNTVVRSSADPVVYKQMLALAENMMGEVLLKPYDPPAGSTGTISGCVRVNADDLMDYAAYTDQPVCDIDGSALADLDNFTVSVQVAGNESLADLVNSPDVRKVTVTVKVKNGGPSVVLVAWRTRFAS